MDDQQLAEKGFERIPILRGFTEIEPVFTAIKPYEAFICGGHARYMCSPKRKPAASGDVDVYSQSEESFERLNTLFTKTHNLEIRHENHVSKTFKLPKEGIFQYCPTIQLIKPVVEGAIVAMGDVLEVLDNFDFAIVRIALINEKECIADKDFLSNEKNNNLTLKNIHCPVSSLLRCMKYGRKGYFLRPYEAMKLFADWDNRTDEYRLKLFDLFQKSVDEGEGEMSQEEIDELESLLRID